jgi:hypothetical protein
MAGVISDSGTSNWVAHDIFNTGALNTNTEEHNGQVFPLGNVAYVATNFTTSSTSFVPITGLAIQLPANVAVNLSFECHLIYSQATSLALDTFGISFVLPANAMFTGLMQTAAGSFVGNSANGSFASTPTPIVDGTPLATSGTILNLDIHGFIENPSPATNNVALLVETSTGGGTITIYRDSYCRIF